MYNSYGESFAFYVYDCAYARVFTMVFGDFSKSSRYKALGGGERFTIFRDALFTEL